MAVELALARRGHSPVGLAVLDFDGFKTINDDQGHSAGDELLCRATRAMNEALRPRRRAPVRGQARPVPVREVSPLAG